MVPGKGFALRQASACAGGVALLDSNAIVHSVPKSGAAVNSVIVDSRELFSAENCVPNHPPRATSSVLAAITKSLRCSPRILCVHHVTVTRPHSVSSAG